MPQCSAERDLGPGCGVNYCIRDLGHEGDHKDYKGKWWPNDSDARKPKAKATR